MYQLAYQVRLMTYGKPKHFSTLFMCDRCARVSQIYQKAYQVRLMS